MSGAVLSWAKSDEWEDALTDAASDHEMPIFFFQTISESPTHTNASTMEPYYAAHDSGVGEASAAIFGPLPGLSSCPNDESEAACAHHRFVNWQEFVSWWDGDVLSFLARQGVK